MNYLTHVQRVYHNYGNEYVAVNGKGLCLPFEVKYFEEDIELAFEVNCLLGPSRRKVRTRERDITNAIREELARAFEKRQFPFWEKPSNAWEGIR